MSKYTFKDSRYGNYDIMKDGHTMFPEDICKELNMFAKLQSNDLKDEVNEK